MPPKLLAFLPCEKVIVDMDNNVSLITLLQDIKVGIPESPDETKANPKGKIVAPIKWSVLVLWKRSEDDNVLEYEQKVALFDPAGEASIQAIQPFSFGDKHTARNIANIIGFPIHEDGVYLLKLWLRRKGDPETPEPLADYELTVAREQPKGQA